MTTNPNLYSGKFDPALRSQQVLSAADVAKKLWYIKQGFKDTVNLSELQVKGTLFAGNLCVNTTPVTTANIANRDLKVTTMSMFHRVCKSSLVDNYYSEMMPNGALNDMIPVPVMEKFVEQLVADAANELCLLRWLGDTTSANPILNKMDGVLTKIRAALPFNAVTNPTGYHAVTAAATIDATNVIAEMNKVIAAIPVRVRSKGGLKLIVSPEIAFAYAEAVSISQPYAAWQFANASSDDNVSYGMFANTKIEVIAINQFETLEAKTMLLGKFNDGNDGNLLLYTDALTDFNNLIIQDRSTVFASDQNIDFVWQVRQGVDVFFYNDVVLYS